VIVALALYATSIIVPFLFRRHAVLAGGPLRCSHFQWGADAPYVKTEEQEEFMEGARRAPDQAEVKSIAHLLSKPLSARARTSVLSIQFARPTSWLSIQYDGEVYAGVWDRVYFSHHLPLTACTTIALTYTSEPRRVRYAQVFFRNGNAVVQTGPFDAPDADVVSLDPGELVSQREPTLVYRPTEHR